LWIMLLTRPASLFHHATERQILATVRRWLRHGPSHLPIHRPPLAVRTLAATAGFFYRAALRRPASTLGWTSLARRGLGEVMMHRHGSCPFAALTLITEARGRVDRTVGEDEFSALGAHQALALLYEGSYAQAEEILTATASYYSLGTKYVSGLIKVFIIQALCMAAQGKRSEAAQAVQEIDDLAKRFR
ncbi:MAG: hypothetical protein M3O15_00490, partial [Acidobacteriota bacterium]|nr:hypothetical protein [Acidobacteriota bacterium]